MQGKDMGKSQENLVDIIELEKKFPIYKGILRRHVGDVHAVDGVSLSIKKRETFGLVGESGCGKSTLGRTIIRLYEPTDGKIIFMDRDITNLPERELRPIRPHMQMIFQDPYASLNPRMTIQEFISEPLRLHHICESTQIRDRVAHLLETVQLNPNFMSRYPHEFSGGQRQRVGIARALALQPELIVCDEPISALDVSIQAQIINLLQSLQEDLGVAYLFIAHDLSVVRHISHRVGVMYLGKIVELADCKNLYENPLHPYTKALLSAAPIPDPAVARKRKRVILEGDVASPIDVPQGCSFHPRCPMAEDCCQRDTPKWREVGDGHWVACHFV
ncbi:MAG: ATP-binding cassette domain-containing protein [Anaerolineaceae bacterium]|jgi:oligopeptide transport system ATP-binding protein|nr:ATP-binding cassette domain-containing protein [Anaerolineaceae bacterium]